MNQTYKLSDTTISQIVQLIQLGILTGTDVSDQMRTMRVIVNDSDGTVCPDPDYLEMFNENLKRMKSTENE
tara:strand:- start:1250 stop:1462 length:213 start_codon:yes stop_codon:yes gene_type:complete